MQKSGFLLVQNENLKAKWYEKIVLEEKKKFEEKASNFFFF